MLKNMVSSKTNQESLSPLGLLVKDQWGGEAESPDSALILVSSKSPGSILGTGWDTAGSVHLSPRPMEGLPREKENSPRQQENSLLY